MWANLTLDIMYTTNYNTGFPTTRTDSLLRITHWQYWWWFWFTYFLVLYYFLALRLFRFRVLKFRPKIATTTRSHGKWGDVIVCLLPISWCINILTNSNLILRMLEWQAESSLFTVRVRGKQWYWIYKFELKTITDILSAPKNIGHNKWFISFFNDLKVADDYLHIMQLRSQNNWVYFYWNAIFERHLKDPNFYVTSPQELLLLDYEHLKETNKQLTNFLSKQPLNFTSTFNKTPLNINNNNNKTNNFFINNSISSVIPEIKEFSFDFVKNSIYIKSDFESRFLNVSDDICSFEPLPKLFLNKQSKIINQNYVIFLEDLVKNPSNIQFYIEKLQTHLTKYPLELQSLWPIFKELGLKFPILGNTRKNQNKVIDYNTYFSSLYYRDTKIKLPLIFTKKTILDNFYHTNLFNSTQFLNFFFSKNKTKLWLTPINLVNSKELNFNQSLFNFIQENKKPTNNIFNNFDSNEVNRWLKFSDEIKLPIRLIKTPLKYTNFNDAEFNLSSDFKLFRLKFNDDGDLLQHKPLPHSTYLVYKQKRYQRRDKFVHKYGFNYELGLNQKSNFLVNLNIHNTLTNSQIDTNLWLMLYNKFFQQIRSLVRSKAEFDFLINLRSELLDKTLSSVDLNNEVYSLKQKKNFVKNRKHINPYLVGNQLIVDNLDTVLPNYKAVKKSKNMSETASNALNRRLLRTKRTLVLPAHVNITIITNSYDVIHSWFIPGLGLKLDCIPGRATHHMLHIDNVGFYYGQCAEICGRYHHHMPIRICALPFEHFLVWWHTFGLPKMLNINSKTKLSATYSSKKYSW